MDPEQKNKIDDDRYDAWQYEQEEQWESLCLRCGACCGALDGDPCEHLEKKDGVYQCAIYAHRFGEHRTLAGRVFRCVPVRIILSQSWPGDQGCIYKKNGLSVDPQK